MVAKFEGSSPSAHNKIKVGVAELAEAKRPPISLKLSL